MDGKLFSKSLNISGLHISIPILFANNSRLYQSPIFYHITKIRQEADHFFFASTPNMLSIGKETEKSYISIIHDWLSSK
jgi:hypothetical protein